MIEGSQIRAAGEMSSPGSIFFADSYFGIRFGIHSTHVSAVARTEKIPVILPELQVAGYS